MSNSYSNIIVNGQSYPNLLEYQMNFVKFCLGLKSLKTMYNLTEVSITIDGKYTYNNIEILSGPDGNIYNGQNWSIKWVNQTGTEQNMSFTLKNEGSKHTDFGGGNKKRGRTKGKKIKRKKTKKQTRK